MHAGRVGQDVESANLRAVSGTPRFFINGQRHYGAYDAKTLTAATSRPLPTRTSARAVSEVPIEAPDGRPGP